MRLYIKLSITWFNEHNKPDHDIQLGIGRETLIQTKHLCGYIVYILASTIIQLPIDLHSTKRKDVFSRALSHLNEISLTPLQYLLSINHHNQSTE